MREKKLPFEAFLFLVHGVIALLLWNVMALLCFGLQNAAVFSFII